MDERTTVIDTLEAWEQLGSDLLAVHPERCVRVRNRHASCRRCEEACTAEAITSENGALSVRSERCVGCGTCATVCPTGALEIAYPNDAQLFESARAAAEAHDGTAVFACLPADRALGGAAGERVRVVCLSRLEETLVIGLFAAGVRRVVAQRGDCAHCPRANGCASIDLVKRTVDELTAAWNIPATYEIADLPACARVDDAAGAEGPVAAEGSNAVRAQAGELPAREATAVPLPHVTQDGTLPHFVPERREQLLDELACFGDPVVDTLDCRLWGHVTIDRDACASCRMCAVFCPTGALSRFDDDSGELGVEHYVAECVHCKLCQDICPESAIASSSKVPALQLARSEEERYPMDAPTWHTGPDQILRRMQTKIGGREVAASYGV